VGPKLGKVLGAPVVVGFAEEDGSEEGALVGAFVGIERDLIVGA
jgi:hypothetical protein